MRGRHAALDSCELLGLELDAVLEGYDEVPEWMIAEPARLLVCLPPLTEQERDEQYNRHAAEVAELSRAEIRFAPIADIDARREDVRRRAEEGAHDPNHWQTEQTRAHVARAAYERSRERQLADAERAREVSDRINTVAQRLAHENERDWAGEQADLARFSPWFMMRREAWRRNDDVGREQARLVSEFVNEHIASTGDNTLVAIQNRRLVAAQMLREKGEVPM